MQHRNTAEIKNNNNKKTPCMLAGKFLPSCGHWTAVSQRGAAVPGWSQCQQAISLVSFWCWCIHMGIISWLFYPPNCTSWLQEACTNLWTKSPIVSDLSPVPYFLIPTGWLPRMGLLPPPPFISGPQPSYQHLSLSSSPTRGPFHLVHSFPYSLALSTVRPVITYSLLCPIPSTQMRSNFNHSLLHVTLPHLQCQLYLVWILKPCVYSYKFIVMCAHIF